MTTVDAVQLTHVHVYIADRLSEHKSVFIQSISVPYCQLSNLRHLRNNELFSPFKVHKHFLVYFFRHIQTIVQVNSLKSVRQKEIISFVFIGCLLICYAKFNRIENIDIQTFPIISVNVQPKI